MPLAFKKSVTCGTWWPCAAVSIRTGAYEEWLYLHNDMLCQAVDLYVLILLVQEHSQLVSQCKYISSDLSYCGQV